MGKSRTIDLVVEDWQHFQTRTSMSGTEKYHELAMGQLHGGSTFAAQIVLDEDDWQDMVGAFADGYVVTFYAVPQEENDDRL